MQALWVAGASVVTAAVITAVTIVLAHYLRIGRDDPAGVQKFHRHPVPRLGGVPVFVALCSGLVAAAGLHGLSWIHCLILILCAAPAFAMGLAEDVTCKVGATPRLFATMLSAALGWALLGGRLTRLDLPPIDTLLTASPILAFGLTLVATSGVAHAVNIIDGFNGLSGFVSLVALSALGFVAFKVGDPLVFWAALAGASAVFGFLLWNFPFGRIFLGDAGAYVVGFWIAELSIQLVSRHREVSAWFPMLLMIYPVWETLFSMYRRARRGVWRVGKPDAQHLHHLIHRRIVRPRFRDAGPRNKILVNSLTSIYLWPACTVCALVAVAFRGNAPVLIALCLALVASYQMVYVRIVRFRTQDFLGYFGRAARSRADAAGAQTAQLATRSVKP